MLKIVRSPAERFGSGEAVGRFLHPIGNHCDLEELYHKRRDSHLDY